MSGDGTLIYKFVNFGLLGGLLGWLLYKNAGPFFRARGEEILDKLGAAERRGEEAAARSAEIARQLAGLGADMEAMRAAAAREMEAEAGRIQAETARLGAKIEESAAQEIAAAAKAARQELRVWSAQLALDLARRKVEAQMSPAAQDVLVDRFIGGLGSARGGPRS
jgi:F-type H+-transporting ATPase subunit b